MPTTLLSCGTRGATVTATRYFPLCIGFNTESVNEPRTELIYRVAGTLSRLRVYILVNATTAASTFAVRVNAATSALAISIPSGTTGAFSNLSDSVGFSAGNKLGVIQTPGSVNNLQSNNHSCLYESSTMAAKYGAGFSSLATTADSSTFFRILAGEQYNAATEADVQAEVNSSTTFRNLQVNVLSNSRTTSCTYRFRVNGANGNQSISVSASSTGFHEDTSNTDLASSGDLVNYSLSTGTGGGTLTENSLSCDGESAVSVFHLIGAPLASQAAGVTRYWAPGSGSAGRGGEAEAATTIDQPGTASNLMIRVLTNTASGSTNFVVRKSGADTALDISVPTSTTGSFEDTDSVPFAASNTIDVKQVVAAGTGAIQAGVRIFMYAVTPFLAGDISQPYPDRVSVVGY